MLQKLLAPQSSSSQKCLISHSFPSHIQYTNNSCELSFQGTCRIHPLASISSPHHSSSHHLPATWTLTSASSLTFLLPPLLPCHHSSQSWSDHFAPQWFSIPEWNLYSPSSSLRSSRPVSLSSSVNLPIAHMATAMVAFVLYLSSSGSFCPQRLCPCWCLGQESHPSDLPMAGSFLPLREAFSSHSLRKLPLSQLLTLSHIFTLVLIAIFWNQSLSKSHWLLTP